MIPTTKPEEKHNKYIAMHPSPVKMLSKVKVILVAISIHKIKKSVVD
jgi:hypothetical protein